VDEGDALVRFSRYLAGRDRVLWAMAGEIVGLLDTCESGREPARGRASDLMWLWTLGAYEVVRTICQARGCFAGRFYGEVAELKAALERVRVANTKMERVKYDRRARAVAVPSEREADLWDAAGKDLRVGDPAATASARGLLAEYVRVMRSLAADEVLGSHEGSLG
jgi:hypothetical protein